MVCSNKLVALGAALLHSTSLFVAAADEFRLVKTSDEDVGTWMTEEQKWDLTAQGVKFIDITDTIVSCNLGKGWKKAALTNS